MSPASLQPASADLSVSLMARRTESKSESYCHMGVTVLMLLLPPPLPAPPPPSRSLCVSRLSFSVCQSVCLSILFAWKLELCVHVVICIGTAWPTLISHCVLIGQNTTLASVHHRAGLHYHPLCHFQKDLHFGPRSPAHLAELQGGDFPSGCIAVPLPSPIPPPPPVPTPSQAKLIFKALSYTQTPW